MREEACSTREFAALLVSAIERAGGTFTLNDDAETFTCDLDGVADFAHHTPEIIAHAVLCFSDDIRAILLQARTHH